EWGSAPHTRARGAPTTRSRPRAGITTPLPVVCYPRRRMESIVTSPIPLPQRDPTDLDVEGASQLLAHLESEARALGNTAAAAAVHHAMGRVFIEQLADAKSAAACYQNAFLLNPAY